jgi:ankyrin repeat protein
MVALDNQHFALARHLLERGANPHIADWWGRTALYIATDAHTITSRTGPVGDDEDRAGALDLMRRLLDAGVDPNPQLNMHRPGRGGNSGRFTDDLLTVGATPLLRAALSFDDEAIRLLLERGARVDLPNGMGVTPLMAAAGFGTSIRDIRGSHTAPDAEARSIATMKILLAAGADVNARVTDTSGRTARIARPSAVTDRQGQTAIYGPINWGWTSVVKLLLDNGARLDVADAKGKTPLDAIKGNAGGRDHKTVPEIVTMIEKAAKKS